MGVYESFDGGKSWAAIPGEPQHFFWAVQTSNGNLYGIANENIGPLWRYQKSNRTWEKFHPGAVSGFAVHPTDEDTVFACVDSHTKNWGGPSFGNLAKTVDAGKTWQRIKDGKGDDYSPWRVYIDLERPEAMLMNTTHHWDSQGNPTGIMRGLDAGKSWHSIQANHSYHWPDSFTFGGLAGRVYTCWHNGGLMQLDGLYSLNSQQKGR